MRCYYEVLGISKEADDSQIKSAYKKLALKWHPDKNLENAEEAKEQFQLVQQAYEVLSDRQERAWYDNHREQILRGSNSEFKDNCLDVFQYFTTTCFKGYGDDPNGFYTVYRNVFEKLAKEDLEFMEDKDEFCQIPSFGDSYSDYDEVVGPFYAYWTSYSTKKSYVWLDPYNLNEIRDRKIFKIAEKKNKKIRQQAKKERNDEVRNLVAFVRKRDKRVQDHAKKIETKILENRQKYEQISKQKRLERKKLHDNHTQAEWTKFDNVKSELEEIERRLAKQFGEQLSDSEEDQEDNNEDEDNLYCVACNKIFKTPKALQNHEASKKHKENLQILQETMLDEENDISESSEEQENDVSETLEKNAQQQDVNEDNHNNDPISDIDNASDISLSGTESKKKKKNNKKTRKIGAKNILVDKEDHEYDPLPSKDEIGKFSDDDSEFSKGKKQKKKTKKSSQKPEDNRNVPLPEDNRNVIKEVLDDSSKETTTVRSNKKSSKRKDPKSKKEANSNIDIDVSHCCATCKSNFPSKNKLFEHLKSTGHGVYLSKEQKKNKTKKNINDF